MEIRPLTNLPVQTPVNHSHKIAFEEVKQPNEKSLPEKQVSREELGELVKGANQFFKTSRTHIQFHIHESLNSFYVEIRDSETNEVIKEVPSKKFLDMVAKFQELAGFLVDEKI
jgi:flagellar protein FlaG